MLGISNPRISSLVKSVINGTFDFKTTTVQDWELLMGWLISKPHLRLTTKDMRDILKNKDLKGLHELVMHHAFDYAIDKSPVEIEEAIICYGRDPEEDALKFRGFAMVAKDGRAYHFNFSKEQAEWIVKELTAFKESAPTNP